MSTITITPTVLDVTVEGAGATVTVTGGAPAAADQVSYTPADGTKWPDPDPINVAQALDGIAAGGIGGGGSGTVQSVDGVRPDQSGNVDLGLGSASTHAATDFDPAGAASSAQGAAEAYADGLAPNYDAAGAAGTVASALTTHEADTTAHNIPAQITAAVNALINGAPGALDTLKELADAMADDAAFSATVTNALAQKAPLASPTFTGTVSGVTKSMVGLGNVDNTSDANKPVSTAQATADAAVLAAAEAYADGGLATKLQGLTRTDVKTSAYTAVNGDYVPCDTSSAGFTVTLPTATATAGAVIAIKHVIQAGTNVVTYACAGSDVFNKAGGGTTGTLPLLAQGVILLGSAGIWTVLADDLPLSQLDARYVQGAGGVIAVAAGGTGASDVNTAKANLGLASFYGQWGGLRIYTHSYGQEGGAGASVAGMNGADTFTAYPNRVAAALGVPPTEVQKFGKSGAALLSPSDASDGDQQGLGLALRYLYPPHMMSSDPTARPNSKAYGALNIIQYGYNEIGRDPGGNTAGYATGAFRRGLQVLISRIRAARFFNDDHSSIAYVGAWTTPTYAFGSKGTSHKTVTNGDSFTITIPSDLQAATVLAVCLVGSKNCSPTLNGAITNASTTIVVTTNDTGFLTTGNSLNAGDVITIGTENILLGATADHVTFTGCTRNYTGSVGGAVAHSSGARITLPQTTATVNWTGTAAHATGSTPIAGQGAAGKELALVKRFVVTSADAGKTIIGTLAGLVGNEFLQVDSYWLEDPEPPTVVVTNQHQFINGLVATYEGANATAFNNQMAAVCGAGGDFDANVILADVFSTINPKIRAVVHQAGVGPSTSIFKITPTSAGLCLIDKGSRLRTLNNSLAGDEMLVTAIDKTNGGANDGDWLLTVTRSYNGTTAGTISNGASIYDMRHVRPDDSIHLSDFGHDEYAAVILSAVASATPTARQAAGAGGLALGSLPRMRDGGYLYNHGTRSTLALSAGLMYAVRFPITEYCIITEIGMEVTTVGSAGAKLRFALALDGPGKPGYLLYDSGQLASDDGTGAHAFTNLWIPTPARYLWVIGGAQASGCTVRAISDGYDGFAEPMPTAQPVGAGTTASTIGISYGSITGAFADPPISTAETFRDKVPLLWIKTAVPIRDS